MLLPCLAIREADYCCLHVWPAKARPSEHGGKYEEKIVSVRIVFGLRRANGVNIL